MMKILAITVLFSLVLTTNCSSSPKQPTNINPELGVYIDDFMFMSKGKIGQEKASKLTIGFDELKAPTVGLCYRFLGKASIIIDRSYYEDANPAERQALLYHELAHCLCNRGHTHRNGEYSKSKDESGFRSYKTNEQNGYFDDSCPNSIMHPTTVENRCLKAHWDEYMTEMFEGCNP